MTDKLPRLWSTRRARLILNLYPPFLFNRVVVREIAADWTRLDLTVERSILNKNLNGTTFGGSIAAAADPIHAILYWQALAQLGTPSAAWTKRTAIRFRSPATTRLALRFFVPAADIEQARQSLESEGRFERTYEVEARDTQGTLCAQIETLVHLRRKES